MGENNVEGNVSETSANGEAEELLNSLKSLRERFYEAKASGDELGQAHTLGEIGMVLWETGQRMQAIVSTRSSLKKFRAQSDLKGEAKVKYDHGRPHHASYTRHFDRHGRIVDSSYYLY